MNTLLKYSLIASFLVGGLVGNVWAQTLTETTQSSAPKLADSAALPAKDDDAMAAAAAVKLTIAGLVNGLKDDTIELPAEIQTAIKPTLDALAPAAKPAADAPTAQ